ncbi:MAG: cytochrome P450 [Saccharopolyspora sp.]|uniref:cytochrome P450 n=1 Tax=Saccharopolyspora TaxID=1835 RepID=UPI00190D80C6|nr:MULTISPECIES: cytochrome P450 [unclassified Saccharopolyspora]MBK0867728.1 cytochrome P450 [Saccharopolyspora sp. HNM0986]MBQ6642858.1 cytochrome P450 [Saccharopolyspora sp.]
MKPPGPADPEGIDFAFDDIPELHEVLARLRAEKPYASVPFAGTRAVLLLTRELVSAAFKDEGTFPAAAIYPLTTQPVLGRTLQCMSGREHRINRAVAAPPFRRSKVAEYVEPLLEPLAHELIDRFAARGEADLVAEFTSRYPVLLISRMLGLPAESEGTVRRWAQDLFNYPLDPDAAMAASAEFTEHVRPILDRRRREPGADLISMLVTETAEDEHLDDEQVLAFLRLLFPAGADTTVFALANTLAALLSHPDQLELVRCDPDEHVPWAIWEGLRWEPPVGLLPRICPETTTWQGIEIPAGTPMIFSINAALRDPAAHADPHRFDVTRRSADLLAFGQGPHTCLGTWFAVAELQAGLKVLLRRLPGLRLRAGCAVRITSQVGTALRGPDELPVRWER